jgi:hypothetical protein
MSTDLGRSGHGGVKADHPFPLYLYQDPLFMCAYVRSLIRYSRHGSSYTREADRKASHYVFVPFRGL